MCIYVCLCACPSPVHSLTLTTPLPPSPHSPQVPALLKISQGGIRGACQMLVMAPTRELAMQSDVVVRELSEFAVGNKAIRSVCIYGGVSKGEQKGAIRAGIEIVVATPGRLKDLVDEGCLSLAQVK